MALVDALTDASTPTTYQFAQGILKFPLRLVTMQQVVAQDIARDFSGDGKEQAILWILYFSIHNSLIYVPKHEPATRAFENLPILVYRIGDVEDDIVVTIYALHFSLS